jgi:TorA maturation chaperone TorD
MTEVKQDWAAIAAVRQGLHRTFGKALLPPTHGLLATLRGAAEFLEAQDLTSFAFYPQWLEFRERLAAGDDESDLKTTYVRLFASGVDGALCPPTETWYKADARLGESARMMASLEADYRSFGLTTVGTAEPPDHAATELEAMSVLCARESMAWRSRRDPAVALGQQDRFLRSHLATWFGDFVARVRAADDGGWYHAVAIATDAYVIQEVDLVRALRRQLGAM